MNTGRSLMSTVLLVACVCGCLAVTTAGCTSTPPPMASTSAPTSASTSAPASCRSGSVEMIWRAGQPPPSRLCVRVGTKILIDLKGPPGYRWTPLESSAPQVVSVTPRTTDGVVAAVAATATARLVGRAHLTTTDSFSADPHGPPTQLWSLNIVVVG